MIEKQTVLDQIEITRSGAVQLRFALLLVEDGNEIDSRWHRTIIEPGQDIDQQIKLVNAHLAQMGKGQIGADDLVKIKKYAAV